MRRNIGILDKLNLKAGMLSDVEATEEVVANPEEQAEIIANGAETIVTEEVAETEALLNEVVAEDEIIEEELAEVAEEQEIAAEGLQSDFTAVTTRSMIKSIEKINARYGKDSIVTAGMQSDKHGGHKALYIAGLQAKENFLKNAAKNVWALIQSMIQKVKEMAQKAMVFLNADKKSADKLLKIIKGKKNSLKEGVAKELSDKEKEAIGNKFGAWLSINGNLSDYPSEVREFLMKPVDVTIETKNDPETDEPMDVATIVDNKADMTKKFQNNKDIKEIKDKIYAISVVGKTLKYVVEDEAAGPSVGTVTVSEDSFKNNLPKEIPALSLLESFADSASKLASELQKYSTHTFKVLGSTADRIKQNGKEDGKTFATIKKTAILQSQVSMALISSYTATQKTMIWIAGAFVNKYEGTDATAEDKKTSEAK